MEQFSTRLKVRSISRLSYTLLIKLLHIGGRAMLAVIPGHASLMNKVVSNFWSRLPHHASPMNSPKIPVEVRMSEALETLVALTGCERGSPIDPLCALSFSCLSPDVIKVQSELLEHYKKDCYRAFSPLSASGRPLRKYNANSIF